jgi:hypothetical protein
MTTRRQAFTTYLDPGTGGWLRAAAKSEGRSVSQMMAKVLALAAGKAAMPPPDRITGPIYPAGSVPLEPDEPSDDEPRGLTFDPQEYVLRLMAAGLTFQEAIDDAKEQALMDGVEWSPPEAQPWMLKRKPQKRPSESAAASDGLPPGLQLPPSGSNASEIV